MTIKAAVSDERKENGDQGFQTVVITDFFEGTLSFSNDNYKYIFIFIHAKVALEKNYTKP